MTRGVRVGIDIGGTFTDLVAVTEEGISVAKVASTPSDPARAFAEALGRFHERPDEVLHGTTVGTNAVLTRSGARLGFVTTEGFRHLLHLARQDRPSLYDMRARRPEPLVEIERCVGVPERIAHDGAVIADLDEVAAREAIATLEGVDGVVVTLLHAYANPAHERRVVELVRDVLGDVAVSASSDVLPEFREYERASTTALNAYVQPTVSSYLNRVREQVGGSRVGVMWSGGGVRDIASTIELPVHTLYSGPAAGVLGATWAADVCGVRDLITLDMGGTSADVALVDDGRPTVAEASKLDGLPFRTPCIDLVSVGAGGGSIGWVDDGGALRVGPASAGADPGPACYGRGGTEATVTDAQVVLGYLGDAGSSEASPYDGLAGGELRLDHSAALAAVRALGARCGLDVVETAHGMLRVVRATMARAIRTVSIERGKDVRRYALVAFGGAGPLHATALARELDIRRVLVPPAPGTLAALGLLVASSRSDASMSRPMPCDPRRDGELRSIIHELTERVLADLANEGIGFPEVTTLFTVDCRYVGQSHELRIDVRGRASFAAIADAFHVAHQERFGFSRRSVGVEAVTFRAAALGPAGVLPEQAPRRDAPGRAPATRAVAGVNVPVHLRGDLGVGTRLEGPAIVVELDATTWIDEGSTATVHAGGTLDVTVT